MNPPCLIWSWPPREARSPDPESLARHLQRRGAREDIHLISDLPVGGKTGFAHTLTAHTCFVTFRHTHAHSRSHTNMLLLGGGVLCPSLLHFPPLIISCTALQHKSSLVIISVKRERPCLCAHWKPYFMKLNEREHADPIGQST